MALLYFSAPSPLVSINPVNMWYCVSVDCLFFSWTVADSCILSFPVCVHTVMIVSQVPCLFLSEFVSRKRKYSFFIYKKYAFQQKWKSL